MESIFKLIYIDPDIMQTSYESDQEEDIFDNDEQEQELEKEVEREIKKEIEQGEDQGEEQGGGRIRNRLKRQETKEIVMAQKFQQKYAKEPILNQRYEDVFRNKKSVSSDELSTGEDREGVFDPNKRREEELSIAAPGEEQDLLRGLGVDEWVSRVDSLQPVVLSWIMTCFLCVWCSVTPGTEGADQGGPAEGSFLGAIATRGR